jgi:trehalose/maltose transport system substrate-binding protein
MGAATLGGWQMAVSNYSKNVDAAVEFANLYSDPKVLAAQPFMGRLLPVFTSAVAGPSTATAPKWNKVSNNFFANVADVLTGEQNGTDVVANIEFNIQDLLGFETGAFD